MADHIPDPGRHRTLFYSYYKLPPAAPHEVRRVPLDEEGREIEVA